jgi:hypothetical protein
MNAYTAIWGGLLAASGVIMHFLLLGLGGESFFMSGVYLPPAQIVSYGVTAAGVILFLASFVIKWPRYVEINNEVASRYFGRIALVNALAAAIFAAPMLVPSLELPILLTEWPGIYIVIAYGFFVIFGVIGMLAWSMMYRFTPAFFSREFLDRRSVLLQLILSEVGIYTVSTFLFLAGYIGASLVHDGKVGSVFVGASMEFSDIPAAVSIFIIIVSVFLGAVNILMGKGKTTGIGTDAISTLAINSHLLAPSVVDNGEYCNQQSGDAERNGENIARIEIHSWSDLKRYPWTDRWGRKVAVLVVKHVDGIRASCDKTQTPLRSNRLSRRY